MGCSFDRLPLLIAFGLRTYSSCSHAGNKSGTSAVFLSLRVTSFFFTTSCSSFVILVSTEQQLGWAIVFVSYLELVTDQAIEETDVGIPEPGQEDVLLDIGRFASELGEGTLLLGLEGLDLGRAQSLKMKGGTELGRSSSAYSKKKGDRGH